MGHDLPDFFRLAFVFFFAFFLFTLLPPSNKLLWGAMAKLSVFVQTESAMEVVICGDNNSAGCSSLRSVIAAAGNNSKC